jgi:thioredoxin-dependent peroxiredoxin
MKARDFSLPDQNGVMHALRQYKGRWVILYFYPKDDTPGCTKEACNFRDSISQFQKINVVILGVSKDSVQSHNKFAEKYHLNFPLLSDENKVVLEAYDAWGMKKMLGREYMGIFRKTYLINPDGEIVKVYEKVNPLVHAGEILRDLQSLITS